MEGSGEYCSVHSIVDYAPSFTTSVATSALLSVSTSVDRARTSASAVGALAQVVASFQGQGQASRHNHHRGSQNTVAHEKSGLAAIKLAM